ncbi:MAG: right-handed parallel beta-helix repeat-containing protein [Candidatus Eisenbacteria bacterium]|uniref:Right-handed parallel beta-helix repeat-containing protein n=1 Tax=Eiseniibacteriota bacterium TaxID=2212470 RepID=A0A7Y2H2G6_UNCEI|nr:right-handed parallel beta-helix repeat-containing protein [Candidatus Eisenbacteria bacterium]
MPSFFARAILKAGFGLSAALLVLLSFASSGLAETRVGGTISGEETWDKSGSPYIVYQDIIIPEGAKLNITPGTTVRFKPNIADQSGVNQFDLEILVHGELFVEGAPEDSVYFTSDASKPTWQDWQGIVVKGENAKASIYGAHLEFCSMGVRIEGGVVDITSSTIQGCHLYGVYAISGTANLDTVYMTTIGNTGGTGIGVWGDGGAIINITNSFLIGVQSGVSFSRGSTGTISFSVVSLCVRNGVIVRNSNPTIHHTSISGNEYGLIISAGAAPTIYDNNLFNNGIADLWIRDYRKEVAKVDVSKNFWGTTDLAEIEERVLDAVDNPDEKGYAVVEPFLNEAAITDAAFVEKK